MLNLFESLIHPYPEDTPDVPPRTLFAFLYAGTRGLRPLIVVMAVLTALIGVFEALLFGFLGSLVDWLAKMQPETLWAEQGEHLALLAVALLGWALAASASKTACRMPNTWCSTTSEKSA